MFQMPIPNYFCYWNWHSNKQSIISFIFCCLLEMKQIIKNKRWFAYEWVDGKIENHWNIYITPLTRIYTQTHLPCWLWSAKYVKQYMHARCTMHIEHIVHASHNTHASLTCVYLWNQHACIAYTILYVLCVDHLMRIVLKKLNGLRFVEQYSDVI